MSKLVDKTRLAKLAQGLYDKLHAEVQAEKTRAEGAEAKALADAKKYTDDEIGKVNSDNSALAGRVKSLESFKTEQVKDNADQLALINGKVSQGDYNAKMELLDQKDNALQAAINAEVQRAEGVEGGLGNRIKAIEDDYLKAADKTELEGAIGTKVAQTAYNTKVQEIEDAIEALGVEDGKLEDAIEAEAKRAAEKEGELAQAIADEKSRAEGEEEELLQAINKEVQDRKDAIVSVQGEIDVVEGKVETNIADIAEHETRIGNLEGKFGNGEGTVEAQIAAAIAKEVKDRDAAILVEKERAEDVEQGLVERLEVIEGEGEGSINKAVADLKEIHDSEMGAVEARVEANENKLAGLEKATVKAEIEQAEADAKAYADQKITALVDSAPDAMNTLNELAKAINDNKSVYDTYVEQHATAMSTMKSDLQAEIDADVLVEKNRAEGEEGKIRKEFVAADTALETKLNSKIATDIAAESAIRVAAENKIVQDMTALVGAEETRAVGREDAIEKDYKDADKALDERVKPLEAHVAAQPGVDAEQDRRISALETFKNEHSHEDIEKDILDNADAIAVLNGDVNTEGSVAKTVDTLHNTIKGEMAQIVSSLKVQIVNDKLQIGLGKGVDFVVLNEQALNMATDDDINEIINGLGVEEE